MGKAALAITGGLEVRVDAKVIAAPDRYMDGRGKAMWTRIMGLLDVLPVAPAADDPEADVPEAGALVDGPRAGLTPSCEIRNTP